MKYILTAVSLALIASPVLAAPFEQTELDRQLPNVEVNTPDKPYVASAGMTRSDREISTDGARTSVWATDHNFIAPAK